MAFGVIEGQSDLGSDVLWNLAQHTCLAPPGSHSRRLNVRPHHIVSLILPFRSSCYEVVITSTLQWREAVHAMSWCRGRATSPNRRVRGL